MNSKKGFFTGLVIFAVLMMAAVLLYSNLSSGNPVQTVKSGAETQSILKAERKAAPNFTVLDADGNTVSLSDFAGKPVVVNFWASWCGPCKEEMPYFDEVHQEMGDKLVFMMVNMTDNKTETTEMAKEFVKSNGYGFPLYLDTHQSAAIAYAISGIPATYLIDKDGNVAFQHIGTLSKSALKEAIELIYSEDMAKQASPVLFKGIPSNICAQASGGNYRTKNFREF